MDTNLDRMLANLSNVQKVGEGRHPELSVGAIVRFLGAIDEQVNWGSNDDPRPHLKEGDIYEISYVEIHSWHTKISLKGFEEMKFNSASFRVIHES